MKFNNINKKQINNKFVNYTLSVFSFFILFEILIRELLVNADIFINVIKLFFCTVFIVYIIFVKKKIVIKYKYIHLIFLIFFIILITKILKDESSVYFIKWIISNNNVNYFLWYIYFFIFSQLYDEIDINIIINIFKKYNYIIMIITCLLFITNNYLGMVSYDNMLSYAWVGTNRMRVMSIFGNPNHAGLYFVLMMFILDYQRILRKEGYFCLNNILLSLFNIFTFSRTSICILIVYIFIRGFITKQDKARNIFKSIINKYKVFLILIISVFVIGILIKNYNIYFFNINYLFASSRWEKWAIGIVYIFKFPFIGASFGEKIVGASNSFQEMEFSDNMFIEIGSRFGFVLMIMIIVYIIYILFKAVKNKDYIKLVKLQLFIIASLLSGTIHFSVPVFLFAFYTILFDNSRIK